MLFSRVVSYLAFFLTLGILATAKPVELENRASVSLAEEVVSALKSKTDSIVPQIKSAASSKPVSASAITPLLNELITAFNEAHSSLGQVSLLKEKKRQNANDVANTFAGVVTDVAGAVKLIPVGLPGLPGLIVSLDVALSELLVGLDVAVVGLGVLLGGLLTGVAGLLGGLGLGLTLGLLGL
ncbi:uncharacterized protein FOMMEDRAFT_139782 [Fomitiporia mediterranea MF3/22]|uniref:uncharacterized protein n=1 Tax=Fomitiporia mediterranea (strain MF3/22) TaxID=694068 RepID=UPI00044095B0|nr:uncharacterized protein FOMMEDRAFT_139782 [Fomitiporia mediterranea MF3/22]EJD03526.1 hypothetical protein FOMMEDRAFT_139782 [Fomitiporia mediterranea MF3/22]